MFESIHVVPTLPGSRKKIRIRLPKWFRVLSVFVLLSFVTNVIAVDIAQAESAFVHNVVMLPPGSLVSVSPVFSLPSLKAITVDPKDPFKIDFIVDNTEPEKRALLIAANNP